MTMMKIIHTADLHLGQILYQNYDRVDEHAHFFAQLERWCKEERPDALILSGDVFDIQQPSASTKKTFTDEFVRLHKLLPKMKLIITAGNHDSASRIQADQAVWEMANARLVGVAPSPEWLGGPDGWQDDFIVELKAGYVVTIPYRTSDSPEVIQSILDRVAARNSEGKPVVMTGHLAVTGMDPSGHDFEIGKIKTLGVDSLGRGYDYLALGHIHKPQTIGHQEDCMKDDVTYPSGVVRYSGSALHVSCDEAYPHTVSVVEMEKHGGDVRIRQLRIDELRHFYVLPQSGAAFTTPDEALKAVEDFAQEIGKGYIRLRLNYSAAIPANFNNAVYDVLAKYQDEIRFNPKHIWEGKKEDGEQDGEKPVFEVADIQQMTDPMVFIEKTWEQYPGLDLELVREMFRGVEEEIHRMDEEEKAAEKAKAERKAAKNNKE